MQTLKADIRAQTGKRMKTVRAAGFLPAVVYGPKIKNEPISVPMKDFEKVYTAAGETTLVELDIKKKKIPVLIYDVARDPITSKPIHADFYAVDMKKQIRAKVPLVFEGGSVAVKEGGILVKVMHELEVEALPEDLPHGITVRIDSLSAVGDRITIASLSLPSGVKVRAESDDIVAIIEAPRKEEEVVAPVAPTESVVEVKTEQEIKRAAADAKKKEEEISAAS